MSEPTRTHREAVAALPDYLEVTDDACVRCVDCGQTGLRPIAHGEDCERGASVERESADERVRTDGGRTQYCAGAGQATLSQGVRELVEPEREDDGYSVICPDCEQVVSASKGAHRAPEDCEAAKVWGWECSDCENVLPSHCHDSDASGFNDRIVGVRASPRGGSERWIPVPASSVDGRGSA